MSSRTALVLETNPVITERYLDYTHDSDWRIMLKDSLNDFLEKLQHEKFNLIVAEESLLPQGIIQMMRSTGIPFLLATNNKNPEIPTLPRNFNRTELLTVFDRLVPYVPGEPETDDSTLEDTVVNDILSGLEDEEETFELTSDAVVTEAAKPHEEKNDAEDSVSDFFGDGELFCDEDLSDKKAAENTIVSDSVKPAAVVSESEKSRTSAPSFNDSDIDSFVNSLSLGKDDEKPAFEKIEEEKTLKTAFETPENDDDTADFLFGDSSGNKSETDEAQEYRHEITEVTAGPVHNEVLTEEKVEETTSAETAEKDAATGFSDDALKAAVAEWLNKNARSIIKEIVLEQLASLSEKKND